MRHSGNSKYSSYKRVNYNINAHLIELHYLKNKLLQKIQQNSSKKQLLYSQLMKKLVKNRIDGVQNIDNKFSQLSI